MAGAISQPKWTRPCDFRPPIPFARRPSIGGSWGSASTFEDRGSTRRTSRRVRLLSWLDSDDVSFAIERNVLLPIVWTLVARQQGIVPKSHPPAFEAGRSGHGRCGPPDSVLRERCAAERRAPGRADPQRLATGRRRARSALRGSEPRQRFRAHDLRATFVTVALASGRTETCVPDRRATTDTR